MDARNHTDSGTRLAEVPEGRGNNRITDEDFRERNAALRTDTDTDETEGKLVKRGKVFDKKGQAFDVTVKFERDYNPEDDKILVHLVTVSKLKIETVDFLKQENREAHRTDEYEIQQLIVRRGQAFDITVTFNRGYNPDNDVIVVQFVTGKRPQESKGSIVRVAASDALTPKKWGMQVKEAHGNTVRLSVMPSAVKAIIGRYEVFIETKRKGLPDEKSMSRYKHEEKICILFNAWCADDTVYMENEEQRNEYVLNEDGHIWRGSARWFRPKPWTFGQFEDVALDSALWLLDKAGFLGSNPIDISRALSAMTNSMDFEGGVLVGNWGNDYPEGTTRPTTWNGSTAILEEYWKTKKPVRYGQCWVFSGLATTLMRALGIPTRSVTNFDSAHDTDGSMTIDKHYDEEGERLEYLDHDSVWNFHVWNESWFKRPDLPEGHDGWQAHDATPQETSDGVYQCGPASVKAIKNGEVYLPHDTKFVFAEVNGDRVRWDVKADGSMEPTIVNARSVGKAISTKAVGADTREDLTLEYKYPEGSIQERQVMQFVSQYSSRPVLHDIYKPTAHDVTLRLEVQDLLYAGTTFDATLVVQNTSNENRKVKVNFAADLIYYTGVPAKRLKTHKETFVLGSLAEKRLVLTIEPDDYLSNSNADTIELHAKGMVKETNQSLVIEDVIELIKPELTVKAESARGARGGGDPISLVEMGEDVKVTAFFQNPLPIPLTNGRFHFDAERMTPKATVTYCKGSVGAKEEARAEYTFTTARSGKHHIRVSFESNELTDVRGQYLMETPKKNTRPTCL